MDLFGVASNELFAITAGIVWAFIMCIVIGEVAVRIAKFV